MDGYYIGLMTGSSADAVDAALVRLDGGRPTLLATRSLALPDTLQQQLIEVQHGAALNAASFCRLHARLGSLFADVSEALIANSGVPRADIRAIGCHGQTLYHLPNDTPSGTWQIGDPAQIAERTGITVVADFRSRDMAAGGQGAPLAPMLHHSLLRTLSEDRCVLNLGGIANLTILPGEPTDAVLGFDTGPANALMDRICTTRSSQRYDRNGERAARGTIDVACLDSMRQDPYFAREAPKSTGRDYFNDSWMEKYGIPDLSVEDALATLAELTALTVADAVLLHGKNTRTLLVCGGGAANGHLMARLSASLDGVSVRSTASEGIDPQWMESILIAVLAARTLAGKPATLTEVTGAMGERIGGAIYPG